jgi:hypothetical protein
MTLDLAQVAGQIAAMVRALDPTKDRARFDALRQTWGELDSAEVAARLRTARSSFLLPAPQREYRDRHALPTALDGYTVAATDGSFILPSRHSPARYFLLNTGRVLLHYGDEPRALLDSKPVLKFGDDDLVIGTPRHRLPVNGTNIGPKRAAEELLAAAEILEDAPRPAAALQDGTLVLWALETLPEPVADWTLPPFIKAMQWFQNHDVPVASYVSAPGSTELVNLARIAVCDYPPAGHAVNCDHCRSRILSEGHSPACDVIPQVTDRYLFGDIEQLGDGERSAIFSSTSKVLDRYAELGGGDLKIDYFYLNAGYEIGRVELPRWVSRRPELVELVHWVVYDQCRLGRGYPVALQEAHEQAVLSTADRLLMEIAIERELARHDIVLTHSGKDGSKRGRFV